MKLVARVSGLAGLPGVSHAEIEGPPAEWDIGQTRFSSFDGYVWWILATLSCYESRVPDA
jgi:hypothetical protein